jgi:hypothetical protein
MQATTWGYLALGASERRESSIQHGTLRSAAQDLQLKICNSRLESDRRTDALSGYYKVVYHIEIEEFSAEITGNDWRF